MKLLISNNSSKPIYEQLEDQIRNLILTGTLAADHRLPSIRSLAKSLSVSVITIKRAYDDLESEGYLYTSTGIGSFVSSQDLNRLREKKIQLLETDLEASLKKMKEAGISLSAIQTTVSLLWEEGD